MKDDLLIPMRELLAILFRRKWSMLIIFFSTVFSAIFLVYFLISPGFGANATIIMNNASALTQPLRDGPPESDLEKLVRFTTQQDVISSLRIASEAEERINLAERRVIGRIESIKIWMGEVKAAIGEIIGIERWQVPWDPEGAAIAAIEDNIQTASPPDSNAIFVSYRAKDPVEAVDVLNAVLDVYSEYYYGIIRDNADGIVSFLEHEYDEAVRELEKTEIALTEFKLSATNYGPDSDGESTSPSGGPGPQLLGISDSLRIQQEISTYMLQLEEELRMAREISDNERRQRVVEDIESRMDTYIDYINQLPNIELEMVRLNRAYEIATENYNMLARNLASARLVAGGQTEQINLVEIFQRPVVETTPISPRKRLIVVLAAFMGVVLALTWVFVWDYLDHTIRTATDIERYFNLRVLGSTTAIS